MGVTRLLPLLLVLLTTLCGCVEAEEEWTFDAKGGGTYELVLRWNADLWRRVEEVLGAKVMRRFAGHGFPLRPHQMRDGLAGLEGVEITRLEQRDTDSGLRELVLGLRFKRLADLLRWEVIAGRTLDVGQEARRPGEKADDPAHVGFAMEPIARVPVLDTLAALLEAEAKPPPQAPQGLAERDPGPLERLGLAREASQLVYRMVKLPLEQVRLRVRVNTPGPIVGVGGEARRDGSTRADFSWDFAALRSPRTDRRVRLRWRMRTRDSAPEAKNTGRSRAGP